MRVRTHLRGIRLAQRLSITDVCEAVPGLARGEVSMFERGHSIPRDDQADRMVVVYGPVSGWYPATVARALVGDLTDCLGCGEELDPDAKASRRYHDDACRSDARNRTRRKRPVALASAVQNDDGGR
jgi:hypothetical protein